jgi:hypothetical protein
VASARPQWEPISEPEVKDWRRHLDKGAVRESNTAHTVGLDEVDSDGDTVTFDDAAPAPLMMTELASPREVADDIFGMMWTWAKGSRENFALMAQMIRHNEPESYGHLTDDELATKLEDHAKTASRKATEKEFADREWDRGNDLDMWQGKPVTP